MSQTMTEAPRTTPVLPLWSSPIRTHDGRLLPSHGPKVCAWIENNVRLGRGDFFGQRFRLTSYQRRWIYRLFEFYPETVTRELPLGRLRYKRAGFGTGKGGGKTPFEGALGAEGLAGPTAPEDPLVLVAAAGLGQSNLVFGDTKVGVSHESSPLKPFVLAYDLSMQLIDRPGQIMRVSAAEGTNDGPRATRLLADELHEWLGRLWNTFDIIDGAIGKRLNAFTVWMSTAGSSKSTLLGSMYDRGVAIATGEIIDDGTLFEWYEIPDTVEVPEKINTEADLEQWRRAILYANPGLIEEPAFLREDYIRSRFDGAQTISFAKWLRYHGNRFTKTEEIWLPPGSWATAATPERKQPAAGEQIFLAFAGTYDQDSAALVGCTPDGFIFPIASWEEPEVPHDEVEKAVLDTMATWRVQAFKVNPNGWNDAAEKWKRNYRRQVGDFFDWQYQLRKRAGACSVFFTAVVTHALTHDGSPGLARHLESANVTESKEGAYIGRGSRDAEGNVELAVAAVMAFDAMSSSKPKRGVW